MKSDLLIRAATVGDLSTIVDFNTRLAEETEHFLLDREILQAGVSAVLADASRGHYDLASSGGMIVGQMMHTREWSDWRNGDIWWLQSVYVHPDHRRCGVFRALYEHLTAQAAADPSVVGLRLYVEAENRSAQTTYQHMGMVQSGYLVMQRLFGPKD